MREVVLDTETTGLNYKSGDRIIEVGCVELSNHVPTGKTYQFYCNVEKTIDEGARRVHGISNDFLKNHSTFEQQVVGFLDFLKEDTLIIHNSEFDMGFINNELKILGLPPIKNKIIDTVSLARKKLNTRIANLDYLCRRFSIDLAERDVHGALLDSQLLAEVYLELKGGKQISMNLTLENSKNSDNLKKNDLSKMVYSQVEIKIEEINDHKQSIKQVKNPMWRKIDY